MSVKSEKYNVPVVKKDQPDDSYKFQPLPKPTGAYPYHLALEDIQTISSPDKLVFHMMGDSGSLRNTDFLKGVTGQLVKQFSLAKADHEKPLFLYHLGDVVYNHGEASQYQRQFFEPFRDYPAPIVAIPGNHDSDVNPESAPYRSLDAFKAVFCASEPGIVSFSGNAQRKSMAQPNIYWTLQTPLANIIGLYSNVPKFGVMTAEQRRWLVEELKTADSQRPGKAIILCIHHSPYSADMNHGSSKPMIQFLEKAYLESGVRPDIVFSGHVHNYQRFLKHYPEGEQTTYVVAGAGGYDELHALALKGDPLLTAQHYLLEGVELQKYCDDRRGFLKLSLERKGAGVTITGNYYILQMKAGDTTGSDLELILADVFVVETGQDSF